MHSVLWLCFTAHLDKKQNKTAATQNRLLSQWIQAKLLELDWGCLTQMLSEQSSWSVSECEWTKLKESSCLVYLVCYLTSELLEQLKVAPTIDAAYRISTEMSDIIRTVLDLTLLAIRTCCFCSSEGPWGGGPAGFSGKPGLHGARKAPREGGGLLQGGVRESTDRGGEAAGYPPWCGDWEEWQGQEDCRAGEVRALTFLIFYLNKLNLSFAGKRFLYSVVYYCVA